MLCSLVGFLLEFLELPDEFVIRQIMHAIIGMLDRDRAEQLEVQQRQAEREARAAKRKR